VIDEELDINLEIPHIAYVEVKKPNSKAILFTNPIDKKSGKKFDTPVLMNVFGSTKAVDIFIGDIDAIADKITKLLHMKPPASFGAKLDMFGTLFSLKNVFPKRSDKKGVCQQIIKKDNKINLLDMPHLTTWEQDGGPFITMGQIYTKSLDGNMLNLGMYRLQIYNETQLGMHWQIHKDSNHFFHEYKNAGKKMPVTIAIGGDPLYTWCGQAPLPIGIFELLMYGFIKNSPAKLVKSITNDIYIPEDVDFVIEGEVDPEVLKIEGPFGDHTGYYTLKEPYPMLDVKCITQKKKPVYLATVVGKPPLEDKYMGMATGKIFFPLLKTTVPDLIDYHMPENGVFHNLILAKIKTLFPAHAQQTMHAFWGVGQMSFVKHALFVGVDAPDLHDYEELSRYILNRVCEENILITRGVCDALDHSSPKFAVGGKLGVDCTGDEIEDKNLDIISDDELLQKVQTISSDVVNLKQYFTDTKNPITVISIEKSRSQKYLFEELKSLSNHTSIIVFIDVKNNLLDNPYMLVWRVVNNIDSNRDIYFEGNLIGIDATNKNGLDGFIREWPDDVDCTPSVIESLRERKLIDVDDEFMDKFYL
jgi:4-hydroxy-3-polyprenylbenzoate decarboxylase